MNNCILSIRNTKANKCFAEIIYLCVNACFRYELSKSVHSFQLLMVFFMKHLVILEIYELLEMRDIVTLVELKSASMKHGVQCVINTGIMQLQVWLVDNLDIPHMVYNVKNTSLQCHNDYNIHFFMFVGAVPKSLFYSSNDYNMEHLIVNISCFGNELALLDCQHSEDDNGDSACGNSNDAGVICQCKE